MFEYMYFETVVFNTEKLKCFWPKEAIENHNISEFWRRGTALFLPAQSAILSSQVLPVWDRCDVYSIYFFRAVEKSNMRY